MRALLSPPAPGHLGAAERPLPVSLPLSLPAFDHNKRALALRGQTPPQKTAATKPNKEERLGHHTGPTTINTNKQRK